MKRILLRGGRFIYRKTFRVSFPNWRTSSTETRTHANAEISALLQSKSPCYIGRMGSVESSVISNYLAITSKRSKIKKIWEYITTDVGMPWWDKRNTLQLQNNAGFFAPNINHDTLEKFCKLYLECIPEMDLCGRWNHHENALPFSESCKMVPFESLYPFFVDNSWMKCLEGKTILVVHPFTETIISQYEKRDHLFPNRKWIADFQLKTIKAVQSIAGEPTPYKDWFEALESMKNQIDLIDFDIAIIGCGAYGTPLAAYCKQLGKKVLHLGGGVQLLFGIKGRRWEHQYPNPIYRNMFNEYWVYPMKSETPQNATRVEGSCYW